LAYRLPALRQTTFLLLQKLYGENYKSANIMARSLNRLRLRLLKIMKVKQFAHTISFQFQNMLPDWRLITSEYFFQ
jgi:hypothetical protein